MGRHQNQSNRPRRAFQTSSNQHLVIEISEDGQVQVVSQSVRPMQGADEPPELTTDIVSAPPLHPTLFDGTYQYDDEDTNSEWSVSSESIPTEESDSEMALEEVVSKPVCSVPVIEPSGERVEARKKSISVIGNVRGQAVGSMIDPDSTVLMQVSRGSFHGYNEILECMTDVDEMLNNQKSVVILKYPDVEDSQRSKRTPLSHVETAKNMMELTEDVLRRVQGSSRESILVKLQNTLGELLRQPEDTIAIHTFSREDMGHLTSEAFIGYFSKDDDAALFVQFSESKNAIVKSFSGCEEEEEQGVDRLKSFLQETLHSQERILGQTLEIEPEITISKSGKNVIGVLSFPNSSSALVKTNVDNFSVEQERSEMIRSMKDLLQNLVQQSSGKLLVQTHSESNRGTLVDQIRSDLDESIKSGTAESGVSAISVRESDDKVIGVLSYSGGSIVIQTSSKNWIHAHSCSDPKDLLASIRLMIELFIMSSELTDVDLRSLASIIVQAFHCSRVELSEEFLNLNVLEKIKLIMHQLMNPSGREDPLLIINQIRNAMEDIASPEFAKCPSEEPYSTDVLTNYLDELICEEDSQYENNLILCTLRGALLDVLIHYDVSLSAALEELLEVLKTVPAENVELHSPSTVVSSPGMTTITNDPFMLQRFSSDHPSREVVQKIHNLLGDEEPSEGREVSYLTAFHTLFLTLLRIIGGWSLRVKSFLGKEPRQAVPVEPESESKLEPEPGTSIQRKPSVSFHLLKHSNDDADRTPSDISQQLEDERQKLNSAIDDLRKFLEESLNIPHTWDQQRKGSRLEFAGGRTVVKQRMLHLFSKLLDEAGKLKVTGKSRDLIHIHLDSASGELERKEGSQYVVLSGNVHDRQHNLGLFFEARMMDLEEASKVESEVECVTEIRRLSDESEELNVNEMVPEIVNSCLADVGSERGEVVEKGGGAEEFRLQETLSRYFELIQSYIQETMDPMRETLGFILEKLAAAGTEKIREIRSSFIQTSGIFEENYVVDVQNSQEEVILGRVDDMTQNAMSVQCVVSVAHQSVENDELLINQPSRLDNIECDLRELKQQMTELCSFLRMSVTQQLIPRAPPYIDSLPSPLPSSQSSDTETSFVSFAPTAPTLEEIEGRLSVTVEIVSLEEQRRLSQESSASEKDDQFHSTIECSTDPMQPTTEEVMDSSEVVRRDSCQILSDEVPARKTTFTETELPRASGVFVGERPRRSTASQTVYSCATQTDGEVLPDTVEMAVQAVVEPEEPSVSGIQESTSVSEQRLSLISQLGKRLSSLITASEDSQKRRSTRVSIVEPGALMDREEDQPITPVSGSTTDEQNQPDQDESSSRLTTVSITEDNTSAKSIHKLNRQSVDDQSQDPQRRSTSASIIERTASVSKTVEELRRISNESRNSHLVDESDVQTRRYTPTCSKSGAQMSEEQLRTSQDKLHDDYRQLNEIPVRDSRNPKLCDVVLSYQCKQADEIGRRCTSPVEIYSCHPVGPSQLMVHWKVAPQFIDQIGGFEIYVDGEASMFYYSHRRRTGLLEDIDTEKQHRVVIYCNPKSWISDGVQWAPGVFFYHL